MSAPIPVHTACPACRSTAHPAGNRQKAADRALRAARWAKAEADRTVGL